MNRHKTTHYGYRRSGNYHHQQAINRRTGSPQAKGYSESGASIMKRALKSFLPLSGSPNEDINHNNYTLRQRGRMLYQSTSVAASAINTNRTKVVGSGLTLKSTIDRDLLKLSPEAANKWQRAVEAEFKMWASKKENCDAIGMNNFAGLQQLVLISWLQSGDVFPLIKRYDTSKLSPYSLRIHLIEADRVSTPREHLGKSMPYYTDGKNETTGNKIYDGVEVDENGKVVAYYISNNYPNQRTLESTKWTRVEVIGKKTQLPNILHVMTSERPDQYRGVTYLAPVIEPLLQLRRYTEAELMAALVQAFFTAWIETSTNPADIPMNETSTRSDIVGDTSGDLDIPDNPDRKHDYGMGPGTVNHMGPGEKVNFGNPNIPTAGFDNFVKAICREIGAALELPYDVLMKEFNSSYSAARGALLEAWEAFKMRRQWIIDDFCQPIYEIWLTEAIALGRIKAPGFFDDPRIRAAWSGARWTGPVQGQLDPLKEVKAAVITVDQAFKTHEQVTREIGGGDWNANAEQVKLENGKLAEAGGGTYKANQDGKDEEEEEKEKGSGSNE